MRSDKLKEAVFECYRRMYRESTPPADFDKLMEEAPINKEGQKDIGFENYVLDEKRQKEIIQEVIKDLKIKRKFDKRVVEVNVTLGASPRFTPLKE